MNSIRHKTSRAFYLLALFIVFLCLLAFFNLLYLQQQVKEGVEVSSFKDDIMEMRRHEKNLVLYHNKKELDNIVLYTHKAITSLSKNLDSFKQLAVPADISQLQSLLNDYLELLSHYQQQWHNIEPATVAQILRPLGHQLSTLSDQMALEERNSLIHSLRTTRWTLAGAILMTAVITVFIGYHLSRQVVRPLRELENNLEPIAQGRFEQLQVKSNEQEVIAFTEAFNRMLHELELRKQRLLQTEKLASLGILASGVAHELNNPLGNILSSCQLLKEELHSADKAMLDNWLEQIDSETMRAHKIVSAMKNFGQPQSFNIEPVPLRELIDSTLLLLHNDLKHLPAIQQNIPENLLLNVDYQRFQQVLINLLKNAIDAGDQTNQISLQASLCREPFSPLPHGSYIIGDVSEGISNKMKKTFSDKETGCKAACASLHIKDTGHGITQETMVHIFDPFFTTKAPGQGMGIGLYIAQEIIREHAGEIAVLSHPGQGTEFIIRLPCFQPTAPP